MDMNELTVRYAVITPARNEEPRIMRTVRSMAQQTVPPAVWVIVDDSSTDRTLKLLMRAETQIPFLRVMRGPEFDETERSDPFTAALEARCFNHGLSSINIGDYDFIVKLDADLVFGSDYFETLFNRFRETDDLGMAGGHCYEMKAGRLAKEPVPDAHVRGATKVYRRECFEEIGGIEPVLGWDTIDELRARMKGWKTRSFDAPRLVHLRPTMSGQGALRGKQRLGRCFYYLGYGPVFASAVAFKNSFSRPFVLGGMATAAGYWGERLRKQPRYEDTSVRTFLEQEHAERIKVWRPVTDLVTMSQPWWRATGALAQIKHTAFPPVSGIDCEVVHRGLSDRSVALTFDDCGGPPLFGSPRSVARVLDILKDKKAPATFFPSGNFIEERPALLKRMMKEGHEVGMHGYSHRDLTGLRESDIEREVERPREVLAEMGFATDEMPFRPPYGHMNEQAGTAIQNGRVSRIVMWSVDPKDYRLPGIARLVRRVVYSSGAGDIVLLHGGIDDTAKALPAIIDGLRAKGLSLETVQQATDGTRSEERR